MQPFNHYSVMLKRSVELLEVKPGGVYLDCTLGGGGHSLEILKKMAGGRLIAVDQDSDAIDAAGERLKEFAGQITFVNDNFKNAAEIIESCSPGGIDGAVMDLGVSSYQLDTPERGFSYMRDAPLDMRMSKTAALTAGNVVNTYPQERLKDILFRYGEEKQAGRIARAIADARAKKEIETTAELAEIIKSAIRGHYDGKHPAKRSFQAIRIEVNNELEIIPLAIGGIIEKLHPGGVLVVITFHSLEDRIVKDCFRSYENGCTCPPTFPVCVCGFKPSVEILTRKPELPDGPELEENSRSRSAKLRAVRKI